MLHFSIIRVTMKRDKKAQINSDESRGDRFSHLNLFANRLAWIRLLNLSAECFEPLWLFHNLHLVPLRLFHTMHLVPFRLFHNLHLIPLRLFYNLNLKPLRLFHTMYLVPLRLFHTMHLPFAVVYASNLPAVLKSSPLDLVAIPPL